MKMKLVTLALGSGTVPGTCGLLLLVKIQINECGLEATSGFEPLNKGFADLSLATWVRRPVESNFVNRVTEACQ